MKLTTRTGTVFWLGAMTLLLAGLGVAAMVTALSWTSKFALATLSAASLLAVGKPRGSRPNEPRSGTTRPVGDVYSGSPGGCEVAQRPAESRRPRNAAAPADRPEIHELSDAAVRDATERAEAAEAAKEKAEAALAGMTAFFASLGHEFRTPMNAVFGMAQLLEQSHLEDSQRDMVKTIQGSARSMVRLVDDLLDLSRIQAGRLEFEFRPFSLRSCVEQCIDLVAPSATERVDIAYVIDDSTPAWLVGDETRLRQILLNLLGNALKFTEDGEVVVKVASRAVENGCHEVHVSVEDSGIGIPEDRWESIFQLFAQADVSTGRRFGGSGLGLWIARQLSEMMGGRMWVESTVGRGSTFHFTITAASHESADSCPRGEQAALVGRRLLIVDDNATVGRLLVEQVEAWGVHATAVASGAEALELMRSGEAFDAAIVDRHMPGMDGLRLAMEIRKIPGLSEFPLVMLTTLQQSGTAASGAQVGGAGSSFKAYLAKPVKPARLHKVLLGALAATKQGPASGNGENRGSSIASSAYRTRGGQIDRLLGERLQLRILVADDDEPSRSVAVAALECMGIGASEATDGIEVLESLQESDYDVILMDVHMPGMGGLDATARIRAERPLDRRPYVIALTGGAAEDDVNRCLAAGMDDFITKPYQFSTLQQAIERAAGVLAEIPAAVQESATG